MCAPAPAGWERSQIAARVRRVASAQREPRVGRGAADADLEVQVRPGGAAGGADGSDARARSDARAAPDVGAGEGRVPGRAPRAVAEDDEQAVAVVEADEGDAPAPGGGARRARRCDEVDPAVQHVAARPVTVADRRAHRRLEA